MLNFLKKMILGERADLSKIAEEGAIIIDVRTSAEFLEGNVPGTINIPLGNIPAKMDKIKQYNKPIITCCVSGNRSGMAAAMLRANGVEVYNGGRWQNMQSLVIARMKKNL